MSSSIRRGFWGALLAAMAAVMLLLTGCGGTATPTGGDHEIVLAAARDLAPGVKDPYFTSSILQVWEPLVALGNDGEPKPALATEWHADNDSKVWTFTLRQGVKFHDGEPFNAAAVVANFTRWSVMGYKTSPFYGTSLEKMYPSLERWEAVDDHTVRLTFKESVPTLPYMMASWSSAMFSPKCLDLTTGDFTGLAQGTGPFKIKEVVPNQYCVIERFDDYWGEKAKAKTIRVRVIPTPETRFSALKSGEIMGVVDLGALTPALANELVKDEQFALVSNKMTITHYLTIRGDEGPLADERLKQAISLAIDRQAITSQYFYDHAVPTRNLINSASSFGKIVEPIYDPDRARALVKEVAGDTPVRIRFLVPQYGTDRYPYKEIAEWIQAELSAVGIEADIQILDGAAYKKAMRDGAYEMAIHTRGLATMDPSRLLTEWMSNDERGTINRENHIGFSNVAAQALINQIPNATTIEARREIYTALQEIALEHPVTVPLFEDENLLVHNKKIRGFTPTIYGVTLAETEWAE